MKQLLWLLFVSLLSGLWLSLRKVQCQNLDKSNYNTTSLCYNTSSGKTCFTTFLAKGCRPVRKSFKDSSLLCKSTVPGSSLIVINSLESQETVDSFIGREEFANETIIIDAQKPSARDNLKWSWVNGHPTLPIEVSGKTEQLYDGACVELKTVNIPAYNLSIVSVRLHYICEYSDSKLASSYRQNNKSYVASTEVATWYDARKECLRLGGDLASITDLQTIGNWSWLKQNERYWIGLHRNKWIWNSTGAAITYANWEGGYPDEASDDKCICISPQCRRENETTTCEAEYDRKWWTCNCDHSYAIVCQKEEISGPFTTGIVTTGKKSSSTPKDFKSSVSHSVNTITRSQNTTTGTHTSWSSSSASSSAITKPKSPSETKKTKKNTIATTINIATSTKTPTKTTIDTTTRPQKPMISTVTTYSTSTTNQTAGEISRNTGSTFSMTKTPGLFKSFSTKEILLVLLLFVAVIVIIVAVILIIRKCRHNRRNEESPTKNTKQSETVSSVYATVIQDKRPSEVTAQPGKTIYADMEMIQRPTLSINPIYASVQPTTEAVDMGKGVIYADLDFPQKVQQKPRSADKITACLSPTYSQPYVPSASASSTVYAEPNKPTKSSTTTGKGVKTTDPMYLEARDVQHGAASGGDAKKDPSVVYAEPIKQKKQSKS